MFLHVDRVLPLQEQLGHPNPINVLSMEIHIHSIAQAHAIRVARSHLGLMQPQPRRQAPELPAAAAPQESTGVSQITHIASRQTLAMAGFAQPPTIQLPRPSSASLQAGLTRGQPA